MLIIRYRRTGKRNYAQYKIVVAEKSFPIKGKFVEDLGSYNPHNKEATLKKERIEYWLNIGAQCSDSVHNLLVSKKVIKEAKRKVSIKKTEEENKEADGDSKKDGDKAEAKSETPKEAK